MVRTADGAVRGMSTSAADEFLGIPYAAPPVGPLRWRPPQPAAPWAGVRDATAFAPHCAQSASPFGQASTSENCLFLNVFTPPGAARGNRSLPVMVWIHGGALVTGESNDYDPTKLVSNGTIVVTINYRLGALGFLAHPALASHPGGPSGDYGLMDQQAALRWVQRNIGQFGGNRRNVTIFGESAGGLSVLSQLASPGARGLFAKAIVESGAYDLTQAPLATAEAAGEAFATSAGCASQTAACLRSLPVSTILANQTASGYTPDIDGQVLTQSIGTALSSGQFNRVPVIDGTNHDEWRLFVAESELEGAPVTAANYQDMIASTLGVTPDDRGRHRGAVPAERLPEPVRRARRGRHRRDLRLPRADGGQLGVQVRADLRLRVQRRERAGALPAAGELPVRRGACVRAPVPVRPAKCHVPHRADGTAAATGREHAGSTGRTSPAGDSRPPPASRCGRGSTASVSG